jgi:hypothetical protein
MNDASSNTHAKPQQMPRRCPVSSPTTGHQCELEKGHDPKYGHRRTTENGVIAWGWEVPKVERTPRF